MEKYGWRSLSYVKAGCLMLNWHIHGKILENSALKVGLHENV